MADAAGRRSGDAGSSIITYASSTAGPSVPGDDLDDGGDAASADEPTDS